MAGGRNRRASYLRCLTRGYKSGNRRQRGRGVVSIAPHAADRHRRVGWCGSTLWMLKLRTMWGQDSLRAATGSHWIEYIHDDEGPENKQDSDPRVTHWFARFCRRHSLDEIPQLWHVIAGEMSLVGPGRLPRPNSLGTMAPRRRRSFKSSRDSLGCGRCRDAIG